MADGGTFGGNGEGVEGIFVGGVRVDMVFFRTRIRRIDLARRSSLPRFFKRGFGGLGGFDGSEKQLMRAVCISCDSCVWWFVFRSEPRITRKGHEKEIHSSLHQSGVGDSLRFFEATVSPCEPV